MGLSGQWLVVRGPVGEAARRTMSASEVRILTETEGWTWAAARRAGWIEALVTRIAGIAGQPALGAFVHDSDFAVVIGATPAGEVAFRFPINDFPSGEQDLLNVFGPDENRDFAEIPRSRDERRLAAEGLEQWSSEYAPRRLTAEELLEAIPDGTSKAELATHWLLAEDGVRLIFDRLGVGVEL